MRILCREVGRAAAIILFVLLASSCAKEHYVSWNAAAPGQLVGGPDTLWLFASIQRVSGTTRDMQKGYSEALPVASIERKHEVVVISLDGSICKRAEVGTEGLSFHPNVARVFRHDDTFYLYKTPSLNTEATLFRWEAGAFKKLPKDDTLDLVKNLQIAEPKAIDSITEKAGWKHLLGTFLEPDFVAGQRETVKWNGKEIQVTVADTPQTFEYLMVCPELWRTPVRIVCDRDYRPTTQQELEHMTFQVQ